MPQIPVTQNLVEWPNEDSFTTGAGYQVNEADVRAGKTGSKDSDPLFETRRRILELARGHRLPGHPIGDGARRVWRFRLSELANAVSAAQGSGFSPRRKGGMVQPSAFSGTVE